MYSNVNEAADHLKKQLFSYPWFSKRVEVNPNLHNAVIAYVDYMNSEVLSTIPDSIDGVNVNIHFSNDNHKALATVTKVVTNFTSSSFENDFSLAPAGEVYNEIWKLKRVCGIDNLVHVFFEIHDQDDAVTNLSEQYPEVRTSLEDIYNKYGFDVIYDALDLD